MSVEVPCFCRVGVVCVSCLRKGFGLPPLFLPEKRHMKIRKPVDPIVYNSHIMKPGLKFGRLTTLRRIEGYRNGLVIWMCLCDCGREARVKRVDLLRGVKIECRHCSRITAGQAIIDSSKIVSIDELSKQ